MAKRKNKTLNLAINAISALLGVVAIVMLFVASIGINATDTT